MTTTMQPYRSALDVDTHWMTGGLPPLECPLLIKVGAGAISAEVPGVGVYYTPVECILRVERRQPAPNKNADLSYWTEDGVCFTGRWPWTYP